MLVSIIIFFIIFGVLVLSHEFGHFIIAKRNGIRVNEFMIGMGPTILSKKIGETEFEINLLPVGGACIFDGADIVEQDDEERVLDEHSYPNAPLMARIATILAGPIANFIVGFIFALILVGFTGTDLPVIYGIQQGSSAQEAGLEPGDTIKKINGANIHVYREVQLYSMVNYGEPLDIVYERNGEDTEITLTPRYDAEDNRYYMGIIGSGDYIKLSAPGTVLYSWYEVEYWVRATFKSLGLIFRGHFKMDDLSGPVGVVKVVDDTYTETKPLGISVMILSFLNLATLLSVNLGIMNLLPLPALDGGKIVLLIIEAIRGKKLSPEKEGYVTLAGAIFIIALMVVVLFNDISKFFR